MNSSFSGVNFERRVLDIYLRTACPASAACQRRVRRVRRVLDPPECNAKSDTGLTALMFACAKGFKDIVQMLLKHPDIDCNARCNFGVTALVNACHKGHKEVVQMLLNQPGIDGNVRCNDDGKTALMYACLHGKKDIVQILLNHSDIDCNVRSNEGMTALMYAIQIGNKDIVQMLLNHSSIDCNVRNNEGMTALMYACEFCVYVHKNISLLPPLNQTDDLLATNIQGQNAFILAWKSEQTVTVQWFLDNFAEKLDFNVKDNNGNTAFLRACKYGKFEIIELLLQQKNIDFNATNNNGRNGFWFACQWHNHHVVKTLLKYSKVVDIEIPECSELSQEENDLVYNAILELYNFDVEITFKKCFRKIR